MTKYTKKKVDVSGYTIPTRTVTIPGYTVKPHKRNTRVKVDGKEKKGPAKYRTIRGERWELFKIAKTNREVVMLKESLGRMNKRVRVFSVSSGNAVYTRKK